MLIEKNTDSLAVKRLESLFDDGKYTEIGSNIKEKEDAAAVVTAYGYVNGNPVYAFSQDIETENGAMGKMQAEKILKIYDLAAKTGAPVVGIHDSYGAYIDGSCDILKTYGDLLAKSAEVSGVIPQISVVLGSCTGAQALFAMQADFMIISDKADFWMSGNSDKNEYGKVAAICTGSEDAAIKSAKDLINLLPVNNLSGAPVFEYAAPSAEFDGSVDSIKTALSDDGSYVSLFDGTGKNSSCALATVGGQTVGFVAAGKGNALTADDATKIAVFVRICDAFSIPVVTFVDTDGFENSGIEEIKSMTKLENAYAESTAVKIAVVSGKAQGIAFMSLASKQAADVTFAYENASIMPMPSKAAVEFLWHDKLQGADNIDAKRDELAAEYEKTLAGAENAANLGAVDEIITPNQTRDVLVSTLDFLSGKRVHSLPKKHANILL